MLGRKQRAKTRTTLTNAFALLAFAILSLASAAPLAGARRWRSLAAREKADYRWSDFVVEFEKVCKTRSARHTTRRRLGRRSRSAPRSHPHRTHAPITQATVPGGSHRGFPRSPPPPARCTSRG